MKRSLYSLGLFALILTTRAQSAPVVEFRIGSAPVVSGTTALVPVTLANAGDRLGAFAFYVTTDAAFGAPTVTPTPTRSDLICFVDGFANGVFRVTGFVTGGPPLADGPVVTLGWNIPAGTTGSYPVVSLTAAPLDAIPTPNPEARAFSVNALVASQGSRGLITIVAEQPRLTAAALLGDGAGFRFGFNGVSGASYVVYGSTDLITWTPLPPPDDLGGGTFEFTDPAAATMAYRYYRIGTP